MKKYVIIAGAGISVDPPSNLPSWWEYNEKLIKQIKKEALKLCPEASEILTRIVIFNLGRVKFQSNGDYDQYLNALRISKEHAKNEGRLDTLAEILHEECAVRMMIGEYYLAEQALSISSSVLKNVGRTVLKQQHERLFQQYQERTGDINQKFTEAYIHNLQKKSTTLCDS